MYQTFIKPFYKDIKKFVLDTLFPITCLSCGKEGELICDDCQNKLTVLEHQICIVCQKPAPLGLTHPYCLSPHTADGLISFFDYHDEKVSKILINGKYYFLPNVYKIWGRIIAKRLKENYPQLLIPNSYFLISVPLHKWRLRWRGFNQAEVLCEALGQELSIPYFNVLVRCKSTKVQKDIKKREQRKTNVENAFKIAPHISPPQELGRDQGRGRTDDEQYSFNIKNKNIILVDDVTTTGSTLLEAAKVLKRNGAGKVICLTIARD